MNMWKADFRVSFRGGKGNVLTEDGLDPESRFAGCEGFFLGGELVCDFPCVDVTE